MSAERELLRECRTSVAFERNRLLDLDFRGPRYQHLNELLDRIDAFLSSPQPSEREGGMVMVPREPTEALAATLAECHPTQLNERRRQQARQKWMHLIEDALAAERKDT